MSDIKVKKGGFITLIKIAYRNIFRNFRRSLLCITAVGLAVLLIAFMMSYIEGMLDSARKIAQTFESGHIKITTKEFDEKKDFLPLQYPIENYKQYTDKIIDIEGINTITSRINTYATFTSSKVKHGFVSGIDMNEIKNSAKNGNNDIKTAYYNYTKKSNGILIGRLPENDKNECMIGYRLAKKMEIVPVIINFNEFNWIKNNVTDKQKTLLDYTYNYNESKNIYELILFRDLEWENSNNEKNKNSFKELKKIQKESKEKYLELLYLFMNIEITDIPIKIEKNATVLDSILLKTYQQESFLEAYNLNNNLYELEKYPDNDLKDTLLSYFNSSIELRIPFKIVSSTYSDKYYNPKLVGIFDYDYLPIDTTYIIIPFKKMQSISTLKGDTQSIYIFVNNLKKAPEIKEQIITKLNNDDLNIKDWTQTPFIAMFRQFEGIYSVIYAIFIIVASFLIINTVIMIIHERIKEIGMMGAIGMSRAEIVLVFFMEAVILSILGAMTGTVLAGIVTAITSNMPISLEAMTGGVDFPVGSTIFIKFSLIILIKGFLFGTLITSICTIFPSLKSAFIEPVEALRR